MGVLTVAKSLKWGKVLKFFFNQKKMEGGAQNLGWRGSNLFGLRKGKGGPKKIEFGWAKKISLYNLIMHSSNMESERGGVVLK